MGASQSKVKQKKKYQTHLIDTSRALKRELSKVNTDQLPDREVVEHHKAMLHLYRCAVKLHS